MIQIKGSTIKSRLDFARARGGEALIARLRTQPGLVGECASSGMLSMRVFPLQADQQVSEAIRLALGADERIFLEMGAFSANEHRSLQKIVHGQKTDPHEVLRGMPRQFPQYLSGTFGAARYEQDGPRGGRIIWEGHDETCRAHCSSSVGYTVRLLENSGVVGVTGREVECLLGGHRRCVWVFGWRDATGLRASQGMPAVKRPSG